MRKATQNHRSGMGWLVAASLAVTLAAFGCSSNQYAGNGQPTSVMPTINSVNHSGTTGSSSGTEGLPPMSSSYVNPASRRVDVDAIANLAAQRAYGGVVLGPVDPGSSQASVAIASGQFQSPANAVLPQSTVNSSINSQPTPVITGGDVGAGITIATAASGTSPISTLTGGTPTASAATTGTAATTAALTTSTSGTSVASSASFSPALMNSSAAPQTTGTANPTLPTAVAASSTTSKSSNGKSTTPAVHTTTATTNVNVAGGIQIQTASNGAIMLTNVATHH